jgi:hypothetical protein
MTNPIIPPPELVEKWYDSIPGSSTDWKHQFADQAAQWGADQELEACKQYMHDQDWFMSPTLRMSQLHNARRPKPPTLKEQALAALRDSPVDPVNETLQLSADVELIIRRALEALPND